MVRPSLHAGVMTLVPVAGILVVDPAGWSPFGPAKWAAVVVIGLLAVASVVRLGVVAVARRPVAVWGVFLAWVALAAAVGLDPRLAWLGTPQRHFGVLTWLLCAAMFVAGQSLGDEGDGRLVAGAAVAVAGLAGLWSVAEAAGWHPVQLAAGSRLVGPLGSASYLGAAEVLLVPVAVGVAADRSWRVRDRRLAAGCATLGLVALVASGARAAWVGAAVALALAGWLRRAPAGERWNRRRSGALAASIVVVVAVAFATGSASRVPALFGPRQVGGLSRLAEWQVAATVVVDHPLTGVGPEGYRIAFGRAVDSSYQRTYGRDPLPDRAHDSLLDVAATTGLPGLAAYLLLLASTGVFVVRALRRGPPWVAGVAAGLVGYSAGALLLFPLAEVEPSAWLLAGLVVAQSATGRELVALRAPRVPVARSAAAVIALAAVVAVVFGLRAVSADQEMRTALTADDRGDASRAASLAARAVRLDPGNVVIRLAAAEIDASEADQTGLSAALGQLAAGLRQSPGDPVLGDEAATLLVQEAEMTGSSSDWRRCWSALDALAGSDPRNPAVLLELGVADDNLGQPGPAASVWTEAAALAPTSSAPEADLALLYQSEDRPGEARRAALDALEIDRGDQAAKRVLAEVDPDGT